MGTAEIQYTTIVENFTDTTSVGGGAGSGIALITSNSSTLNIYGSVVAGNKVGKAFSSGDEEDFGLSSSSNVTPDVDYFAILSAIAFSGFSGYPAELNDCLSDEANSPNPISDLTDLYGSTPTLADNGGPTETYFPPTNSLLIDFYSGSSSFNQDQRGLTRPASGDWDVGSVEVEGKAVEISTLVVNGGAAQRSRITQISVTLSEAVDASLFNDLGALTLTRISTPTGFVGTDVQTYPSWHLGECRLGSQWAAFWYRRVVGPLRISR